jgi:hypothetical protein
VDKVYRVVEEGGTVHHYEEGKQIVNHQLGAWNKVAQQCKPTMYYTMIHRRP